MVKDSPIKPGETLLKVNHVDVFYGTFQALWDVSLEVRAGEMLALIGTNSSGKSTLLDTISLLLRPARGSIEFMGKDITGMPPHEVTTLGICQVPEGRCLFPDMSVRDNLIVGSYNARARAKRKQNLKEVFAHFPILEKRQEQLTKTLSGGEQQMVAIGRGLMADPRLMLLDEMSLGLAPIIVNELYRVLKEIKERGITILFVEQNVRRSLEEADRAYIMETGCITLSGDVRELREEEEIKKAYFGL